MSLMNFFSKKSNINISNKLFNECFLKCEGSANFPYQRAIDAYGLLESSDICEEDFMQYLIEDITFSSIYATFYEQVFKAIRENPSLTIALIDNFEKSAPEREKIIEGQTQDHLRFITAKGLCSGCLSCENHADVAELVHYYNKQDLSFFINLYIGMQTIQFAMEQLLYESIPESPHFLDQMDQDTILNYRKLIFSYTEQKART